MPSGTPAVLPGRTEKKRSVLLRRLRRDTSGSTALEFAMVALPFLLFCFSIIGYGFYFFTATSLEYRVETATRLIRTGQAQTNGVTQSSFKQQICDPSDPSASFLDCSKLNVHIQSNASWAGINPTPCLTSGALTGSAAAGSAAVSGSSGGAGAAVLVTVCYEWSLAKAMPFLMLGNMGNGSAVIQAVSAFRTEPYQ